MERAPKAVYTPEFRVEAVVLVLRDGLKTSKNIRSGEMFSHFKEDTGQLDCPYQDRKVGRYWVETFSRDRIRSGAFAATQRIGRNKDGA